MSRIAGWADVCLVVFKSHRKERARTMQREAMAEQGQKQQVPDQGFDDKHDPSYNNASVHGVDQ